MDYTMLTLMLPHSQPTLNLILTPDPEQSGLLKGWGVGERGGTCGLYCTCTILTLILPHSQPTFKLDPDSRSREHRPVKK